MNVHKVYNVVCLLINSFESKRFKIKVQNMHKTKWDRICPEKQQQQNAFFYPTYICRKNLKQFMLTEDEKLQLQFKYELIRSYIIRIKNHTMRRFVQE